MSHVLEYDIGSAVPSEKFGRRAPQAGLPAEALETTLDIEIVSLDEETLVFDFVGADVSLANALRRIMLAEVPSMAIETVFVWENSSIIHDEVLSHRLGLVPIAADPDAFNFFASAEDESTDLNTLVFRLSVSAGSEPAEGETDETDHRWWRDPAAPYTRHVYSNSLEWVPQGRQEERMKVAPVHDDILLAKLRPGQKIQVECHARKGVGKDHAKFQPVATASYRLLPKVTLTPEAAAMSRDMKEELVARCPMDVFDIEDGLVVANRPRDCTMCRECIRGESWRDKVKLARVANHFIFSVETVGAIPPQKIVSKAIEILKIKCESGIVSVDDYMAGADR